MVENETTLRPSSRYKTQLEPSSATLSKRSTIMALPLSLHEKFGDEEPERNARIRIDGQELTRSLVDLAQYRWSAVRQRRGLIQREREVHRALPACVVQAGVDHVTPG